MLKKITLIIERKSEFLTSRINVITELLIPREVTKRNEIIDFTGQVSIVLNTIIDILFILISCNHIHHNSEIRNLPHYTM